jgi:hypothetical protein
LLNIEIAKLNFSLKKTYISLDDAASAEVGDKHRVAHVGGVCWVEADLTRRIGRGIHPAVVGEKRRPSKSGWFAQFG